MYSNKWLALYDMIAHVRFKNSECKPLRIIFALCQFQLYKQEPYRNRIRPCKRKKKLQRSATVYCSTISDHNKKCKQKICCQSYQQPSNAMLISALHQHIMHENLQYTITSLTAHSQTSIIKKKYQQVIKCQTHKCL